MEAFLQEYLVYALTGLLTGLLSGLLGIGGGTLIVPALSFIYSANAFPAQLSMHLAVGSSLAIMIFTAFSATRNHHHSQNVDWRLVKSLAYTLLPGVIFGNALAGYLSSRGLQITFGIFLIFVSLQLLLNGTPKTVSRPMTPSIIRLLGIIVGICSGLLGIGGASLLIPTFLFFGLPIRSIVGVTAAVSLLIAIVGTAGSIFFGLHEPGLPNGSTGYVYWPAVFSVGITSMVAANYGAILSRKLSAGWLTRIFAIFLVLVAISLMTR